MRRAALATVLLFLGQAGICAHAGFGAAAVFTPAPVMASSGCPGMDAQRTAPEPAEPPSRSCERHCAQYAQILPAATPGPLLSSPLWLPVARGAGAFPTMVVTAPPAPERAPPRAPLRLRLASLQI